MLLATLTDKFFEDTKQNAEFLPFVERGKFYTAQRVRGPTGLCPYDLHVPGVSTAAFQDVVPVKEDEVTIIELNANQVVAALSLVTAAREIIDNNLCTDLGVSMDLMQALVAYDKASRQ